MVELLATVRCQLVREVPDGWQAPVIRSAGQAAPYLQDISNADREHVVALLLDVRNAVIGKHLVSIGTLDRSLVSPREVTRVALLANAASVILAHNHLSGGVSPSAADFEVTKALSDALKMFDIRLLDHVIVGFDGSYFSIASTINR